EEILPADLLLLLGVENLLRMHVDRTLAGLDLLEHRVIAQARRHWMDIDIVADSLLDFGIAILLVEFPRSVRRLRLEQQEPRANRTIAILEARKNDLVL